MARHNGVNNEIRVSCNGCPYLTARRGQERCEYSGMARPYPWSPGCRHYEGWGESENTAILRAYAAKQGVVYA